MPFAAEVELNALVAGRRLSGSVAGDYGHGPCMSRELRPMKDIGQRRWRGKLHVNGHVGTPWIERGGDSKTALARLVE